MIRFTQKGDFEKTRKFLTRAKELRLDRMLHQFGREGVEALSSATPVDTGKTAASWDYQVIQNRSSIQIIWTNSNRVDGVPIAIVLQYGHATRNGGYVRGQDYINPAIRPIFNKIENRLKREMSGD